MLRAMPNMHVYRPADGNEVRGGRLHLHRRQEEVHRTPPPPAQVSAAYASALLHPHTPAIMALSRQNVPQLPSSSIEKALKGGYVAFDSADATAGVPEAVPAGAPAPALVVVATGTEVSIAIEGAKAIAAAAGVRVQVASLPCIEVFDAQPLEYRCEGEGEAWL